MCYGMPAVIFSATDGNFHIFISLKFKIDTSPKHALLLLGYFGSRYSTDYESLSSIRGKEVAVEWEAARCRNR